MCRNAGQLSAAIRAFSIEDFNDFIGRFQLCSFIEDSAAVLTGYSLRHRSHASTIRCLSLLFFSSNSCRLVVVRPYGRCRLLCLCSCIHHSKGFYNVQHDESWVFLMWACSFHGFKAARRTSGERVEGVG